MPPTMKIRVEMEKMTNLARVMGWEVEEELITNSGARIVLERRTENEKVLESVRNKMEHSHNDLKVITPADLPG